MTQLQPITPQIKHQTQNPPLQTQIIQPQFKQAQPDDNAIRQVTIVQQKLSVQVMPKSQLSNQQQKYQQTQKKPQNTSSYGPFHELSQNAKALLNTQNLNYDINIEPVLTNIAQQKNKTDQKIKKSPRQKKTQSILTEESIPEQTNKPNPEQLEKEILQLAKNIRRKVFKKQTAKGCIDDNQSNPLNSKRVDSKQPDHKLRQIYQKRQSLFEKYSYPHSTGITLAELQKQQERLKLGKYNTSRVYNEEQQFEVPQSQSQSPVPSHRTSNMQSSLAQQIHPNNGRSKSRTQDSQSGRKQSQLPKLKLSFDKTHHKYKMTEFRKSILRENKEREIAKSLLIKEKEDTLQKRRQIYNNSRYHPVGIKLSSLRLSKLVNQSIVGERGNIKSLEASLGVSNRDVLQVSTFKINSIEDNDEISKQQQGQQINKSEKQRQQKQENNLPEGIAQTTQPHLNNQNHVNASQVKSSLTFNFSFGDPIQTELKTQAQIYNQLQNLTKMLQNDSTPQQKMRKLQQLQKENNLTQERDKHTIKWTTAQVDKQMAESKMIGEVDRLHNSSDDDDYREDDKGVELEYSHV